jgi:hypothetical protein
MQDASACAYLWICAGGCNAVDGPKDKPDGVFIFFRDPKVDPMSRPIFQKKPYVLEKLGFAVRSEFDK